MNRRRDVFKSLVWIAVAAGLAVAIVYTEIVPALPALVALLVAAPVAAYAIHRSERIAGMVAGGMVLLAAVGALLLVTALNDLPFRAPGR